MSQLRSWPVAVVVVFSLGWIGVWAALLSRPFARAERWMRETTAQTGIAAVSFSLVDLLWRLVVVLVPPMILFAAWLMARRAA